MSDPKKIVVEESVRDATRSGNSSSDTPRGERLHTQTHNSIDVLHTTQELPYFEVNFIGTYIAGLLGCVGCFGTYIMPVTSLTILNTIIGPSPNAIWVPLTWTLLSAVSFTLLGRLSDIFGRRWLFASSSGLALIGSIIGATANYMDTLIAASCFLGAASAGQMSMNYTIGELVPIRHRFAALGVSFLFTLPTAALGPWIARLFIDRTAVGWRGIYYMGIAIHGASTVCWVIFYHPPKFENLHRNRTKMAEVRELDFGGIFLFLSGSVLFLLGLSWGGQLYPWTSAYVLSTLIIGFAILVGFIAYEAMMPLKRPLVPMHLFNYDYSTFNVLSAAGGVVYYSMSVLFPTMVATLFESEPVRGGLVSCAIGGGVCAGQFIGSWLAVPGGHMKLKMIFVTAGMTALLAGLAGATDSETAATALAVFAGFMVGLLELVVSGAVTIVIDDQSEIGTAAGVFGSIRAAAGVLATAIYVSILQSRLSSNVKTHVIPALINAGLPTESVQPFVAAYMAGQVDELSNIPGASTTVIQTAMAAFREAYASSFRTVYLATIAFGGLSFLVSFAVPNIDKKLTNTVARRLWKNGKPNAGQESSDELKV